MARDREQGAGQLGLFPVEVEWVGPANLGTADCKKVCKGKDGCEYAVKDASEHPLIPHSEWFCTRLGEMVGIAAPPGVILRMPDGTFAFGSRWEGGVIKPGTKWNDFVSGNANIAEIAPILSRILAFDLFVNNRDRHARNFLFRQQPSGFALLAFDYSRSWITNGIPVPDLPMSEKENTITFYRQISNLAGPILIKNECYEILESIARISAKDVENIVRQHPPEWLSEAEFDALHFWWLSTGRVARLEGIKKGIDDGSYL